MKKEKTFLKIYFKEEIRDFPVGGISVGGAIFPIGLIEAWDEEENSLCLIPPMELKVGQKIVILYFMGGIAVALSKKIIEKLIYKFSMP